MAHTTTTPADVLLGYNALGGEVYLSREFGFRYSLTPCCGGAVTGTTRGTACKGCYGPAREDVDVVD